MAVMLVNASVSIRNMDFGVLATYFQSKINQLNLQVIPDIGLWFEQNRCQCNEIA